MAGVPSLVVLTKADLCADPGERLRSVHEYIAAGDIYQANLSFRAGFRFVGDALALYEQLRAAAARHGVPVTEYVRRRLVPRILGRLA